MTHAIRIVSPSWEILHVTPDALERIESAGRTCYRSCDRATPGSAARFVRRLVDSHHESVLEHASMSARLTCDRGVMAELTRHRLASFSVESTRYVRGPLAFVRPSFWSDGSPELDAWRAAMSVAAFAYEYMLARGARPEEARSVLPNSLATTLVMTANFREWRHVFAMRTAREAHPQMRELLRPMLTEARRLVPVVFDDCGTTGEPEKGEAS